MTDERVRVSLSVTSADPETIARAAERFAAAAAGFALEGGADCFLMIGPAEEDD